MYLKFDSIELLIRLMKKKSSAVQSFFTFSHILFIGAKKSAGGENFIGIVVCLLGEISKFRTSFTIPSFACIIPKRPPMHFLGPSPVEMRIFKKFESKFSFVIYLIFVNL